MYLENSEQSQVSGEGECSTGNALENQCEVLKPADGADSTGTTEDAAALGMKVFVEYTAQLVSRDMERCLSCLEHQTSGHVAEVEPYRNGHTEALDRYPADTVVLEPDQILDECETLALSQPFQKCVQQFNCLESSEQSANHSVACYKCRPCCEHSAEHLGIFQQCKACSQQSLGFERDIMTLKQKDFEVCESSHLISGKCVIPNSFQQEENCDQQSECWDSETPTEDSLEFGTELCDFDEIPFTSCDDHDEDDEDKEDAEENCQFEQTDTEADCDGSDSVVFDGECCEEFQETFELPEQNPGFDTSTGHCEMFENADFETGVEYEARQYVDPEKTTDGSEFCTEEDSFSDCSSIETKSFKTCRDDSITSEPCSDSSGEFEKGAQEDLSDDQTQWESFEDFDEMEQSRSGEVKEGNPRSPVVDVVIEDHFDLFDRADCYGHVFAPRRQYVSCFDGGDVHESLYVQEAANHPAESFCACDEEDETKTNPLENDVCPDDGTAHECSRSDGDSERSPEDLSLEEELDREPCVFYENYEEDDLDWETYAFEGRASASSNDDNEEEEEDEEEDEEEEEGEMKGEDEVLSSGSEENMYAPCADDISVEGDAYEDSCDITAVGDEVQTDVSLCKVGECEENAYFDLCSEMELYWSLVDEDEEGEVYNPGVEDYYAYQIKSLQMSLNEVLGALLLNTFRYEQVICAKEDVSAPTNETGDDQSDQTETGPQAAGVCVAAGDGITVISEQSEISASESDEHENAADPGSENDSWLKGTSADVVRPQDVIYSVLSKPTRTGESEENDCDPRRDFEEEQSDDDSYDTCDCDYCIPPEVQVPTQPLLPQTSDVTGKICVVIDLDETLVHSSFKPVDNPDFIIPVELDGSVYQVYVLKRPHVDEFLRRMGELFECVLFTASLAKYADPVSDLLDISGAFQSRLFRESCVFHKGNYVKDLSRLGRDLNKVIIIDNSPASYVFHPENAIAVESWFDDQSDTELLDLIPFFESLSQMDDIYDMLKQQKTSS